MPQRTDVEKLADSETAGTQIITFSTTTKKLVEWELCNIMKK